MVITVASSTMVITPAGADDAPEQPPTTTIPASTTTTAPQATTSTTSAATVATAVAPTTTAPAGPQPTFRPVKRYDVLRKLVFPVVGVSAFHASFGACRDGCTREHHGIDISAYHYKGLPVVAAHDGTVVKVTYDEGNPGCSVRIRGRDRWETRYYHLNNDIPGTDEIGAPCPAPGIEEGVEVHAGQIIGYLGDSGNGEDTVAHLHFELRSRTGYPIDPYRSLKAAQRVEFEWLPRDPQAATLLLTAAAHPESVRTLTLVGVDEFPQLGASEEGRTILTSPLIAVDPANPGPAVVEIQRLAPEHIVVLSENPTQWLEEMARPLAPLVARTGIPRPPEPVELIEPDQVQPPSFEFDPVDRFPTVVFGVIDRIYRSRKPAYEAFVDAHRALVVQTDRWAPRRIGLRTWSTPGKNADPALLWWLTGSGWIGTETLEEAPVPGIAYVRERMVRPHTLAFLSSLTDLPPYPVWKSS